MRTTGRVLTVLSLAGYAMLFTYGVVGSPDLPPWVETTLGLYGAVAALALFGSWFLAVYHWGTRFPRSAKKRWWGLAVIVGMFIGGWIYWIIGAPKDSKIPQGVSG